VGRKKTRELRTLSHASSLSVSLKLDFIAQSSVTFAQVPNISDDTKYTDNGITAQLVFPCSISHDKGTMQFKM
jgi:hypothetical protein